MPGSFCYILITILATESMGRNKWRTYSKGHYSCADPERITGVGVRVVSLATFLFFSHQLILQRGEGVQLRKRVLSLASQSKLPFKWCLLVGR